MTNQSSPTNPSYESAVRSSFAAQQFMTMIGAQITRLAPGEVEIRLPYRSDLTQQHGFIHGGVIASALDSACGYAAFSLMPEGVGVLSIEFKINLLAPARGEELIVRARVIRAGRTITVCEGLAAMRSAEDETPVAAMIATIMSIRDRPELVG